MTIAWNEGNGTKVSLYSGYDFTGELLVDGVGISDKS
jgi:hypothetical protein